MCFPYYCLVMKTLNLNPPPGLLDKILKRIHREERLLVLRRFILFSTTLVVSIIGFIPTFKMLLSDSAESGFLHFFALIFSDFSTVAAYWQSFAMILLETLPAASLALLLIILFTFLGSLRYLIRNIKVISGKNRLATV